MRLVTSQTGSLGALFAMSMVTATSAEGLVCIADTQCRGDAERMCAPSTLEISVKSGGGSGTQLFIDHQGPYAAHARRDGNRRQYELNMFAGRYTLDVQPDGRFQYMGNRGKRFSGTCRESH